MPENTESRIPSTEPSAPRADSSDAKDRPHNECYEPSVQIFAAVGAAVMFILNLATDGAVPGGASGCGLGAAAGGMVAIIIGVLQIRKR